MSSPVSNTPTPAIGGSSHGDASFTGASHDGPSFPCASHCDASFPGASLPGDCNDGGIRLVAPEDAAIHEALYMLSGLIENLISDLIKLSKFKLKIYTNFLSMGHLINQGGSSAFLDSVNNWYSKESFEELISPESLDNYIRSDIKRDDPSNISISPEHKKGKIKIVERSNIRRLFEQLQKTNPDLQIIVASGTVPSTNPAERGYYMCIWAVNGKCYEFKITFNIKEIYSYKLRILCESAFCAYGFALSFNKPDLIEKIQLLVSPIFNLKCNEVSHSDSDVKKGGSTDVTSDYIKKVSLLDLILKALKQGEPFYIEKGEIKYGFDAFNKPIMGKAITGSPVHGGHPILNKTNMKKFLKFIFMTQGHAHPRKIRRDGAFAQDVSDAVNFMSPDYIFFVFPIGKGHTYINMLRYLTPYNSNISLELAVDSLLYIKDLKDILLLVKHIYVCDRTNGAISNHFDPNELATALKIPEDEITDGTIISLKTLEAMGIVEEDSQLVRVETSSKISNLSSSAMRKSNASHMIAIQSNVPSSSSKADDVTTAIVKPP
jgi:hypothetical protein